MCRFSARFLGWNRNFTHLHHRPKIRIKELQQIIYNPKFVTARPWTFAITVSFSKGRILNFQYLNCDLPVDCDERKMMNVLVTLQHTRIPHQHHFSLPIQLMIRPLIQKDSKFFSGQEANWDNQQPRSTNSIYDNNIPSSHPMEKWYNFRSIEVGSTVGVWRSLFGDVKANHNCWAARSRGEPKTGKLNRTEVMRFHEIPILGRKIKLLGWNIFENVQTNLELYSKDPYLSNGKNPGWLGYIGDYTTQLYRDYNKPL